ncbi:MAG: NUDIX hydrolase [Clostridia bacterium]|nr:NUDIX hydrolase [Clostridia bacterium]
MNTEKLIEKQISSKLVFDGVVAHLYLDEILLPNGERSTREYLKHNGAVAVLAIDKDDNAYIVHQYRYPHGRVITEIPAGKLDYSDEDHLEAALRELREETGLTSASVTYLGEYIPSPALLSEVIYLYYATDLSLGEQDLDEDEFLSVEKIPFDALVEKVLSGEITDGKTVCAVLKVDKMRNEKKQ